VTRAELVQLIAFSPQKVFSVTHWSGTKAALLLRGIFLENYRAEFNMREQILRRNSLKTGTQLLGEHLQPTGTTHTP